MKKILVLSLMLLSFMINPISAQGNNLESLNLSSQNYILYSIDNDEVIAKRNSDVRLSAASINKVLTTITALDLLKDEDLDKEITVYPESLHYLEREASKAGLEAHQVISLREVLYAIMLPSGADATALMSLYLFNSQDGLVDAMNEKAKAIGMNNTNIENTAGLDDPNQYTTLEDLLSLLKYSLQNEDFKDIYTKANYSFKHGELYIENPILTMANQKSNNYIIGAKSGYTLDAKRSLSSLGSNGSESYIFISTQAEGGSYEDNLAFDDANRVYESLFNKTSNHDSQTVSTTNMVTPPQDTSLNTASKIMNISTFIVLFLIFILLGACTLRMINIRKNRKRRRHLHSFKS